MSSAEEKSTAKLNECTVQEEYPAYIPEELFSSPSIPTFHLQKYDIFKKLRTLIVECKQRFGGNNHLATEEDDYIAELCETLDITFQHGLKQPQHSNNFVVSAASLFQNMQEIVIGSSNKSQNTASESNIFFWDFCKNFLTPHEKQRFEQMKQTWTKSGMGRSFVRAALNEHSLHRYILTWLSERATLHSYYNKWALLMDDTITRALPELIKSLDHILFALTVDKTELNGVVKMSGKTQTAVKEEPIIYAPTPVKVENKSKRKPTVVERPIASTNSTEDLLKQISEADTNPVKPEEYFVDVDVLTLDDTIPPDPIEPELEFLKRPLSDFNGSGSISSANSFNDTDYATELKSETSSHCSKYSDGCSDANHATLLSQLKDVNERCSLLETRVAQLSLENRQLIRRLKKHFQDSGIDPSSSFATNFLITIPHVKLNKSKHGPSSHHVYEIHITMKQNLEHWSLWRRYSDFNKLHKSLLKTHPCVSAVEFPPKKRFGNMNERFVEERRQQLQIYLLNLVETLPQLEACKSKADLQKVFPFLRER